jgi:hypothetical protein
MKSKEKDEGLSKLLGGEMERGTKEASPSPSPSIGLQALKLFPLLPLATKLGTFH